MRTFAVCWLIVFSFLAIRTRGAAVEPEVAIFAIAILSTILCLPLVAIRLMLRWGRRFLRGPAVAAGVSLDRVLFNWTREDVFTVRDLLESVAIFGRTGSGKSSGSGLAIARAVVKLPGSSGVIFVSKPEDRGWWEDRFREQGRLGDLIVFGPDEPARCNFLDFEMQSGGDARSLTEFLMVTGESLAKGGDGENGKFWELSKRRLFYSAIEPIRLAWGSVSIPDIQEFVTTAPMGEGQISKQRPHDGGESPIEKFKSGFHYRTMIAAGNNAKTPVEEHDYKLCASYWSGEFLGMESKVRSSILADAMNVLHTYNTGIVREIVSTTTTASPAALDRSKWLMFDFPLDRAGASGKVIMHGAKDLCQKHILRRHARPGDSVTVIWCDEAQEMVSSFDAAFLAKSRSHYGCMVYLTQSIHSYQGTND